MRDKFAKFDRGDLVKTLEFSEAEGVLGFMATCKPSRWGKLGIIVDHTWQGKEWWVQLEETGEIHRFHEHDMKMVFKSQ